MINKDHDDKIDSVEVGDIFGSWHSMASKWLTFITESKNSLSATFSKYHFNSKFNAALQANQFLCSINQTKYQQSILYFLGRSYKFGLNYLIYVIKQLIKYRSNIFIGSRNIFNYKEVLRRRG